MLFFLKDKWQYDSMWVYESRSILGMKSVSEAVSFPLLQWSTNQMTDNNRSKVPLYLVQVNLWLYCYMKIKRHVSRLPGRKEEAGKEQEINSLHTKMYSKILILSCR